MNPDETECLGCFYFYPAGFRGKTVEGADVDVSFWVTQKAYNLDLYPELYKIIKNWLTEKWPFQKINWSNIDLPDSI